MNLMRHHDLELPVFGPEDGAFITAQYELENVYKFPERDTTIVRRITLDIPRDMSLATAIQSAEDDFSALSDITGYVPVHHEYGLIPADESLRYMHGSDERVPKGHLLVAKTAIINKINSPHKPNLLKECRNFSKHSIHADLEAVEQFTIGKSRVVVPGHEDTLHWITDIDIRLYRQITNREQRRNNGRNNKIKSFLGKIGAQIAGIL